MEMPEYNYVVFDDNKFSFEFSKSCPVFHLVKKIAHPVLVCLSLAV